MLQLEQAAKNVHLAVVKDSGVATTRSRVVRILTRVDLAPVLRSSVEVPHIVHLPVVFLLTTEKANDVILSNE